MMTRSKEMFSREKLKNLFSVKDSAFHIPINQPERGHWIFGLVLAGRKRIIAHDPLYDVNRAKNIGSALFKFCKRANGIDTSLMTKWQKDNVTYFGVFTLISSIRAMCLITFSGAVPGLDLSSTRLLAHHGIP